jgi:DNA repair protein RadC
MRLILKTDLVVRERADNIPINSPEAIAHYVEDMRDLAQEVFVTLTLNTKNRVIKRHLVSLGTVNSTLVAPREVFRPAILNGASSIIVAHSHPSGDPSPSAEDIRITRKLVEAGKILEIPVLDHLIIGDGLPFSLRESGLVEFATIP